MERKRVEKLERYLRVARHLFEHPHQKLEEIADAVDLTKSSLGHTVSEMKEDRVLSDDYEVHLGLLGYVQKYRVDIWVNPIHLRNKEGGRPDDRSTVDTQEELARYIARLADHKDFINTVYVEDVRVLLGNPADLSADVYAKDTDAMFRFVTRGLRMCRAINQTSTAQEAWSLRHGDRKLPQHLIAILAE